MSKLITASGGYAATIGGIVSVSGSNDVDVISLVDVAGKIDFDGSFNRGGDIILLPNAAKTYSVVRAGSSILLSDADSTITIPVGTTGTKIQFADGELLLKFDSQVLLGSQAVAQTVAPVTASMTLNSKLPSATASVGKLVMSPNEHVTIGGNVSVVGTNGEDSVTIADIAGNVTFDASFNRGGDEIVLTKQAQSYEIARPNGSTISISDSDTSLSIPLGTAGLSLNFSNGNRTLLYGNGVAVLGNQSISQNKTKIDPIYTPIKITKVASTPLTMEQSGMGESFSKIDIDGDGKEEVIYYPANAREAQVLFKNIMAINVDFANGKYNLSTDIVKDSNGNIIKSEWVQDSAVVDFNKDGILDLIFSGSGSEPPNVLDQKGEKINLLIRGAGSKIDYFEVNKFFVSAGFWHSLSVGDINGDKIPDIAVVRLAQPDPNLDHNGAFFLIGKGDGSFTLSNVPKSMNAYLNVGALVDLNKDGLADYFWGTMWDAAGDKSNPRLNRIYINKNGSFSDEFVSIPFLKVPEGRDPYHISTDKIVVGDYNNDGLEDLLVMYADYVDDNGRWLQLLKNKGDGTFEDVEYFNGYFSSRLSDSFEFFDFNKDGRLDIYQTISFGGNNSDFRDVFDYIFINVGNDKFERYKDIYSIESVGFDRDIHSSYARFVELDGKTFILETNSYDWMSSTDYKVALNLYLIS